MAKKNAKKANSEKKAAQPVAKAVEAVEAVAEKAVEAVEAVVVKATEKKAESTEKKAAEKKPAEKKTDLPGAVITAVKNTAKKAQEKKELEVKVILQYEEKEAEAAALVERVKKAWVDAGHRAGNIKTLDLYVKPEEAMVYFVVNGKETGSVTLF